ncbi:MAG: acetate--CoA ligase family protein [Phycisphaeraceae bacterium]|nr:acetate--CoA ligase family protein [Phycisphaeraceae bacterium]
MARLHEFEGKRLLSGRGLEVPRGSIACSPDEAEAAAIALGGACVVKVQAWTTGRKALGGVALVETAREARHAAARMLGMQVGNFAVDRVLVEERVEIARELFVSMYIDDAARAPRILLSLSGGSGVEARGDAAMRLECDPLDGVNEAELAGVLRRSDLSEPEREAVAEAVRQVFAVARAHEARSVEINPLAILRDGRVVAADCRVTIDDYAVFRHPDLGIEIARELDHPPTVLERIAYRVEQADHRGTFYFAQLNTKPEIGSKGLVGFHGAGGGGSMMSMDAITNAGFTIANFCDTSGNPSAAKVYRAARIILSQPGLCGYFGSGSGVASQEQFWSAYGLAKAFWELNLDIPVVIRLGGNAEDRAVEILESVGATVPATIEGYRKDDPPRKIADRFAALVAGSVRGEWRSRRARVPAFVGSARSYAINGGTVWLDEASCDAEATAMVVRHGAGLFDSREGRPALAVGEDELRSKDSELIACEVECRRGGRPVVFVELEIEGLD